MPEQTPLEQALTDRLNAEMSTSLNLQVQLIATRRELVAAQERLKESEAGESAR